MLNLIKYNMKEWGCLYFKNSLHEIHKFSDIVNRIISYCFYQKAKGENKQMENEITRDKAILLDENNDEYAMLCRRSMTAN